MKLMDGVRRHKKYPETFSIPSRSDKLKVDVGTYVKLGFLDYDSPGERMWVLVKKVGPHYEGILHNNPLNFGKKVLKYGDKVIFEARHILDIITR